MKVYTAYLDKMTKGRHTKLTSIDGRRCSRDKCRKLAKDIIDGEHLCRIHSPARDYMIKEVINKKIGKKKR